MIAVVVPAHDEEALIGACLASLRRCSLDPALGGEEVRVFVVLDRCADRTADICAAHGVESVRLTAGNVGLARAAGFRKAVEAGARWIATTDADSTVPRHWLSAQLAHGCEAFCGIVTVADWSGYTAEVEQQFLATECRLDDHPHVHGANMGLSAHAYARTGGFLPLPAHEDVALVHAMQDCGLSIARKIDPMVVTSARKHARAVGGFSDYLKAMEARLREPALASVVAAGAALGSVGGV